MHHLQYEDPQVLVQLSQSCLYKQNLKAFLVVPMTYQLSLSPTIWFGLKSEIQRELQSCTLKHYSKQLDWQDYRKKIIEQKFLSEIMDSQIQFVSLPYDKPPLPSLLVSSKFKYATY